MPIQEIIDRADKFIDRNFRVITTDKAIKYGLTFKENVYGDEINHLNCRSIWIDARDRAYRVKGLFIKP